VSVVPPGPQVLDRVSIGRRRNHATPPGQTANMCTHLNDPPLGSIACAVEQAQVLERTMRRVEAALIEHLDMVDRSGLYRDDGHRNIRAFQRACAHVSRTVARDRWLTVLLCRQAPAVLDGLNEGDLGVEQVRLLARTAARPRVGHRLTADPEMFALLLHQARTLTYAHFEAAVLHWVRRADQDGVEPDHRSAHEQRTASITVSGDRVIVRAVLSAAAGAEVQAIFDAFTQAEFAHDVATSDTPGWLARTALQRRADAFQAMCLAALGPNGSIDVTVGIVMDAATFDAAVSRRSVPLDAGGVVGRCHTLTGIPLHPVDAATAALWGRIHRVVVDASDTVINLGRSSRLFTGSARTAATSLGAWCEMPGCDHPATDIDHLHPWQRGGRTDQHNAAPLCAFHHRWKTNSDAEITRDAHGRLRIRRVDGTERVTI
jgi:hypothetical protein